MGKILWAALIGTISLYATFAGATEHDIGSMGATYTIAEPDSLDELERRADAIDWSRYFSQKKFKRLAISYKPADLIDLPRAHKARTFSFKPLHTITHDIPDGKGGVIYPAGYQYNPLEYMTMASTLVIINGDDKKQLAWFKHSDFAHKLTVKLLLTDGAWSVLTDELNRPVYYLTQGLANSLGVTSVPSVVKQDKDKLVINEIDVEIENN